MENELKILCGFCESECRFEFAVNTSQNFSQEMLNLYSCPECIVWYEVELKNPAMEVKDE